MDNPLLGTSSDEKVAGVKGEFTGGGIGVWGFCDKGHGVHGDSTTSRGVVGTSRDFHGVFGTSTNNVGVAAEGHNAEAMNAACHSASHAAIVAVNDADGVGVQGRSGGNVGVLGESDTSRGVHGTSNTHVGVSGDSQRGPGVRGTSVENRGAEGFSTRLEGVAGISKDSTGVLGISSEARGDGVVGKGRRGVVGESETFQGVFGHSKTNAGVVGESDQFDGVYGVSHNPAHSGVSGHNLDDKGNPSPGGLAGFFEGNVEVTGNIELTGPASDIRLTNGDCAEDFDVCGANKVEPGTVMVLRDDGTLSESQHAYDRRVAGVISGAGDYKPAIVLDARKTGNRQPIALVGKVFCKADAQFGAIQVGDPLTTSPTPGHAMRAADPLKAFGSVIGKALRPLKEGQGSIPILITLQ